MGELLDSRLQAAVAQMRTASDENALKALVLLAAEPPAEVLAALLARLMEYEPGNGFRHAMGSRLPDDDTVDQVLAVVATPKTSTLLQLGGGTYDGLLALLVATLSAVDDKPADARP